MDAMPSEPASSVGAYEVTIRLADLLDRVGRGEYFVITRHCSRYKTEFATFDAALAREAAAEGLPVR